MYRGWLLVDNLMISHWIVGNCELYFSQISWIFDWQNVFTSETNYILIYNKNNYFLQPIFVTVFT